MDRQTNYTFVMDGKVKIGPRDAFNMPQLFYFTGPFCYFKCNQPMKSISMLSTRLFDFDLISLFVLKVEVDNPT